MIKNYLKLMVLVTAALSISTSSFANKDKTEKSVKEEALAANHVKEGTKMVRDIAVKSRKRAGRFLFVIMCAHAESAGKKIEKCEE